jgi:hypothetical protein
VDLNWSVRTAHHGRRKSGERVGWSPVCVMLSIAINVLCQLLNGQIVTRGTSSARVLGAGMIAKDRKCDPRPPLKIVVRVTGFA